MVSVQTVLQGTFVATILTLLDIDMRVRQRNVAETLFETLLVDVYIYKSVCISKVHTSKNKK